MIISRTPFRISYTGGCSDIKHFYQNQMGAVVSSTIDKYVYLSMHPLFNNIGYHLKYFKNEIIDNIDQIQHPIIKQVFTNYLICGVDFNSSSDVPSGTGLGSSSSFTVGLINLCNAYKNIFIKKEEIAREACGVEIDMLKSPIGKQDQYAAATGGINYIQFNPDESVIVEKINLSERKFVQLENSLLLFYLGSTRNANSILAGHKDNACKNIPIIKKMVRLSEVLSDELKNDSIENFGKILDENWRYKKELGNGVTNAVIDEYYNLAMNNGAEGGKVCGAGSSGFLLLYIPQSRQQRIRKLLNLYELPFKLENSGTTIIY
jgi:D-glycero-alpha-D-manno-heptose-7-phosphate kinase